MNSGSREKLFTQNLSCWRLEPAIVWLAAVLWQQQKQRFNKTTLVWLLPFWPSDPRPRGLSDRGVWGCLQSQGAEGGSTGGDGAMGWHPHSPPCAGTQPQDLGFPQRAARVGSVVSFFFSFLSLQQKRRSWWTLLGLCVDVRGRLWHDHVLFHRNTNH